MSPSLAKWNSFSKKIAWFLWPTIIKRNSLQRLISLKNSNVSVKIMSSEFLAKKSNHQAQKYVVLRDPMILWWNRADFTTLRVIKVIAQIPEHTIPHTFTENKRKSHSQSHRWRPWPFEIFSDLVVYIYFSHFFCSHKFHGKMVRPVSGFTLLISICALLLCLFVENIYVFSL